MGCKDCWHRLSRSNLHACRVWGRRLLASLVVGGVLLALAWNWRIVDLSDDWTSRQRGEVILERIHQNALVFGWWDVAPVVQYLQMVEGLRPDVQVINRFLITPQDLELVIAKEVKFRPVYIDNTPNELSVTMSSVPTGPIYRLVVSQCRTAGCRKITEPHPR